MMHQNAQLFKALSDETRLRIITLLLDNQELCVCHIVEWLTLPQSTVSRHLAYLKRCNMVKDRREGLWMYYSLDRREGFGASLLEFLATNLPKNSTGGKSKPGTASSSGKKCCP